MDAERTDAEPLVERRLIREDEPEERAATGGEGLDETVRVDGEV